MEKEKEQVKRVEVVWQEARQAFALWNKHYSFASRCAARLKEPGLRAGVRKRLRKWKNNALWKAAVVRRNEFWCIPLCMLHIDLLVEEATGLCADERSLLLSYLELHQRASYWQPKIMRRGSPPEILVYIPCWCDWTFPGRDFEDPVVTFHSKGQSIAISRTGHIALTSNMSESIFSDLVEFRRRIENMRPYLCDESNPIEPCEDIRASMKAIGFEDCVSYKLNRAFFQPLLDQLAKDTQTEKVV